MKVAGKLTCNTLYCIIGHLPIPSNFTTVGKPQIYVNQYDSPIEVYSEDTIKEMAENRLTGMKTDPANGPAAPITGLGTNIGFGSGGNTSFDVKNSNVMGLIGRDEKSRGQ